jgi:uncharacterized surface anchored protein
MGAVPKAARFFRILLALLIATTLIPITALMTPTEAYAAEGPPSVLTGRFTLASWFSSSPSYQGDFPGTVTLNGGYEVYCFGDNGAGDNGRAHCISPGAANWGDAANANNRGGTIYATWYSDDPITGISWYRMTVTPDIQPAVGASGVQYLGDTWLAIAWDFEGWIKLTKSSTDPLITNANPDYSLAGAVYEVYRSSDDSLVCTLTTDTGGEATSPALEAGSYYLIERTAPKGFVVDTTSHGVTVVAGQTQTVSVSDAPLGFIELIKASAIPEITDNNECYSLEGALYSVYASSADALADKDRIATLTTDATGYARTPSQLALGTYYVREVTAPKGYAADATVYTVAHSRAITRMNTTDRPQGDPAAVLVGKIDADTAVHMPQGAASLEGAEFTVRYFDGYFTTATAAVSSGYPVRTWIVKTNSDGLGRLREANLVAGSDALYHNSAGDATIPLGTVLIQETKAPRGYVLPDPAPICVQQITPDGILENVQTYNAPIVPDNAIRGDIDITKAYDETPDDDTGQMTPESGITFDFFTSAQFEGTRPKTGALPAFSLVTDERGHADTTSIYVMQNPDGSYTQRAREAGDTGALPYDTYLMVQRSAPAGFDPISPMLIQVNSNAQICSYLLQNGRVQTPIRVIKLDAETGMAVPYPASWQVINAKTGKPVSMTVHYPTTQALDTFTSDAKGRLILPEQLPYGSYLLREVQAPAANGTGYVRDSADVPFIAEAGHDWDNPLEVTFKDLPAKGRIHIMKRDADTNDAASGATYVIKAAGDIYTLDGTLRAHDGEVVDTVTTGAEGTAKSRELYLGSYTVIEAISPVGFALDTARHSVILAYEGQDTAVVTAILELTDKPTTLRILKRDSLSKEAMPNVTFSVANDTTAQAFTLTTGTDGTASLGYLPHGSYTVTETSVSFGYATNKDLHHFSIDDQGLIEGRDTFEITVENTPIQVAISKRDITTTDELAGCGLEILVADKDGQPTGEALISWVSGDKPYVIVGGLAPGDYVLHETYPTQGYITAKDVLFSVTDTGAIQTVVMEDDFTKVEISKRDITTDKELPGAHLSIYPVNEDGTVGDTPLYEWISTDAPHLIEGIGVGDYVLREDTAPVGYALAQNVSFTVFDTGEVQTVVMYDEPLLEVPDTPDEPTGNWDKTGRDLTGLFIFIALLAVGAFVGVVFGVRRLCRKERATSKTVGAEVSEAEAAKSREASED